MKWKDVSSFSQGQQDRTPNEFQLKVGQFRFTIHRHIHYRPDEWLVSSYPEIIGDNVVLKSKDIKDAQDEVVLMICKKLEWLLNELKKG